MKKFENKICLVTGAASGIGRATANAFAQEGGKVILSDIVDAEELVNSIQASGGEARYVRCDVSEWRSVEELISSTLSEYGRIDCAVHSAGIAGSHSQKTHAYPIEAWHQQIAVNLTGAWYLIKACTTEMLKQGGGAISLVSSAAGLRGQPGNSPYAASKHGMVGLVRTAALEYATENIRINCVCPTAIETPMLMHGRRNLAENPEALQAAINYQAMKRMGQPEEVAAVNLWLCSDDASFITGQAIPVDGGALVR